jgi:hypothetical protein
MVLVGITTAALAYMALLMAQGLALTNDFGTYDIESRIQLWTTQVEGAIAWYLLGIVTSAIAFLAWLSRAVDNTPSLGGGTPKFTPTASIGWWFVPFANLVQGYRIVADLWRRMAPTHHEQGIGIVLAWWLLWQGGNFAYGVLTAAFVPDTTDSLLAFLAASVAVYTLSVTAGVLLIRIIWVIEYRARERAAAMTPGVSAPLPVAEPPGQQASAPAPAEPAGPGPQVLVSAPPPALAFCPFCGAGRISGTRYCGGCGRDLDAIAPAG